MQNFISNIDELESLEVLNLENNQIEFIADGICNIYDNLSYLALSNNNICPPYPECLSDTDIGVQNLDNC